MNGILRFALTLVVGVVFILLVGSIFQGSWDIAQWPPEARKTAGTCCVLWFVASIIFGPET